MSRPKEIRKNKKELDAGGNLMDDEGEEKYAAE